LLVASRVVHGFVSRGPPRTRRLLLSAVLYYYCGGLEGGGGLLPPGFGGLQAARGISPSVCLQDRNQCRDSCTFDRVPRSVSRGDLRHSRRECRGPPPLGGEEMARGGLAAGDEQPPLLH